MKTMKKRNFLFWLPALLALMFVACSDDDGEGDGGGLGGGQKVEVNYANLAGEWICYYQHWEEGPDYENEAYYNNDDLGITFNESFTGYLKSEGDDELLEDGRSNSFTYSLSGNVIEVDGQDVPWIIESLRTNELQLKYQDGDYIIIAKFTKRASLEGKVSRLSFMTDYGDGRVTREAYEFSYDFMGELNGISYNIGTGVGTDEMTFGAYNGNERIINWYTGETLRLVDNKDDKRSATVFLGNVYLARAEYDNNGYLTSASGDGTTIDFEYKGGNMSSIVSDGTNLGFEYSKEENNASIDLNYFITEVFTSDGSLYVPWCYYELGLDGKRSNNLVSKIVTPDDYDFYYTFYYEKDYKGRISYITRTCVNRYRPEQALNTCYINVEYYNE